MGYVPTNLIIQAASSTNRSRELATRIDDAIRDFKRDHPDVTDDEIRAAVAHATQSMTDPASQARQRKLAIAILAGVFAAVGAMAAAENGHRLSSGWLAVAGVLALGGVLVGVIVSRR